jgi:uncharacterized protein (UPF0333 family)
MKKLVLFAAALVMAGGASAYAQTKDISSEHVTKHRHAMAAHAHWQAREGTEGTMNYRTPEYIPQMVAPPYDDPEAEGRTNGG